MEQTKIYTALRGVRGRKKANGREILGIARLSKQPGSIHAELTMIINDTCQHQGVGSELTHRLLEVAREEKLKTVGATMIPENIAMQGLCKKLGFTVKPLADGNKVRAEIDLA